MKIFRKRKESSPENTFECETTRSLRSINFECDDSRWTNALYSIPEIFSEYYKNGFIQSANEKLPSVDQGNPDYMDREIVDKANEALSLLGSMRVLHMQSIEQIRARQNTTLIKLEYEKKEIESEEARLKEMIEEIGGFDYV